VKLRTLGCPTCGAPVTITMTVCRYCRAPFHARANLVLEAREGRTIFDFTTGATPREVVAARDIVPTAGVGLIFTLPGGVGTRVWGAAPFKDGSVCVEGIAMDPDGGIDVGLRVVDAGRARLGYMLCTRPAVREISVARFAKVSDANFEREDILRWTATSSLRGVGEINRVELLAADSLLQVRINGVLVARLDDARFGFGSPVYGATSYGQPARVALRTFEHGPI
jgi:hypothetical protein